MVQVVEGREVGAQLLGELGLLGQELLPIEGAILLELAQVFLEDPQHLRSIDPGEIVVTVLHQG